MHPLLRGLAAGMLLASLAMHGCKRSEKTTTPLPGGSAARAVPTVYVVNYPLKYFAERLAGGAVDVVLPAPAGEDPAYWEPDAETIASYQQADLILLNGAGYAGWIEHATLPASKLIDTSKAFKDQYVELSGAVKHIHGPEGAHAHGDSAFTTWLDPTLAVQQAQAIRQALAKRWPDMADALSRNFELLKSDLLSLDASFAELTGGQGQLPLLASHPVYQYFARRYGLNLKSVHWEPDEVPGDSQWTAIDKLLEAHPATWMIWEAPPRSETVAGLRQRNVQCAVFIPCGNAPTAADYLQTMQQNLQALGPVFAGGS